MTDRFIGPTLINNLPEGIEIDKGETANTLKGSYGPQLPHHLRNKNEHNEHNKEGIQIIGPVLPNSSSSAIQEVLEERAQRLKYEYRYQNLNDSMSQRKRDLWMTELPPERAVHFGSGPRKFKMNYSSDKKCDRNVWTEVPSNKKEDVNSSVIDCLEAASIQKRNEMMDMIVKKSKKHRKEKKSLLELHEKKMKKKEKKNKKSEKSERRPFDRDTDLHVNRFDEAQKRSIIKKAQQFDTRFRAGKSKYL